MMRSLAAACFLALLSGPVHAGPASDCLGLAQARAEARSAATAHGYEVRNLDGEAAHAYAVQQGVPASVMVEHATVINDQHTGRTALLLNDGLGCSYGTLVSPLGADATTIGAALEYLRSAH